MGNNSPITLHTYQIPDPNDDKSTNEAIASKISDKDVCKEMEDLSLVVQPPLSPDTSCRFERAEIWKNDEEDSEESPCKEGDIIQYIPFIPSYLSTENTNKETPAVTPSPPKCKRSMKIVSFNKNVQHINDDDTVKTSNKKTKRYTKDSPSHDTVRVSNDKAWRYDDDDVSYSSDF